MRRTGTKKRIRAAFCISILGLLAVIATMYGLGFRAASIVSGSMEPTIAAGDLCIFSTRHPYESVTEGDVIVYWETNRYIVAHRVVDRNREGYIVRGDNSDHNTAVTATRNKYIGKVVSVIPKIGSALSALQNPPWLYVLYAAVALCVLAAVLL